MQSRLPKTLKLSVDLSTFVSKHLAEFLKHSAELLRPEEKTKGLVDSLESLAACLSYNMAYAVPINHSKTPYSGHMTYRSVHKSLICALYMIETPDVRSMYNACQLTLLTSRLRKLNLEILGNQILLRFSSEAIRKT